MKRKLIIPLLLILLLTGCYSIDSYELYALPQRSKEYRELQTAVEAALGNGSYSAPVTGANRQVIQQMDLDGDGDEEILVFCKMEGERPLKLLILKREEDSFVHISTLEGDGTAFDSVQYAQLDGQPGLEILLSRRIGEQVQQFLSVYTMNADGPRELMSSGYAAYTLQDLDSDGRSDLILVRNNADGLRAYAELYRCGEQGDLVKEAEASLSTAADSVKRILIGNLAPELPAVFVASAYDESHLITDVFTLAQRGFVNITLNAESGQSSQTVRNYYVYSTDIDNNGVIELPDTQALPAIEGDSDSENQYRIIWYNLSPDGSRSDNKSTYHNFAEGWFLFLPEAWCQNLSVTRSHTDKGLAGTEFVLTGEDGSRRTLLKLYAFSGEKGPSLSTEDGRFLITQRGDVCYSALLPEDSGLDPDELRARFNFISVDLLPES